MNLSRTLNKIESLLSKDGIELKEAKVGTYSKSGEVIRGIIIHGDFDSLKEAHRAEDYLDLAGLFTRIQFVGGDIVVAGDGPTIGLVEEYGNEVDLKFM